MTQRILVVGFMAVILMFVLMVVSGAPPLGDSGSEELTTELCHDTFGDEWRANGYSTASTPPVVHCTGPNGEHGIVDMPPEMQDELDIVVADGQQEGDNAE